MSTHYRLVQWNTHKKVYDLLVAVAVACFISTYILVSSALAPSGQEVSAPILLMRALGVCGILLLHVILAIGPLVRISPWFAPLLYNRRHLGVIFFLVALLHFFVALVFYGGFGDSNPLTALLLAESRSGDALGVPFELFGFVALLIFALMAATSHDFWLHTLGAIAWKWLHMLVYVAYALVVLHVLFGVVRSEASMAMAATIGLGAGLITSLHIVAGMKQHAKDNRAERPEGWIDAGVLAEIPENRARIVSSNSAGEIAVFRRGDSAFAVSNRCPHQGGPLGEGQIIDGCITCPWHGYQFDPESGCSPPPFTDRVPIYRVRIDAGRVLIDSSPGNEKHDGA